MPKGGSGKESQSGAKESAAQTYGLSAQEYDSLPEPRQKTTGLPTLEGSEKQIARANKIRNEYIERAQLAISTNYIKEGSNFHPSHTIVKAAVKAYATGKDEMAYFVRYNTYTRETSRGEYRADRIWLLDKISRQYKKIYSTVYGNKSARFWIDNRLDLDKLVIK